MPLPYDTVLLILIDILQFPHINIHFHEIVYYAEIEADDTPSHVSMIYRKAR